MKNALLSIAVLLFSFQSRSQLLSWSPDFITESTSPVVITVDATKGNLGLLNYTPLTDVFVHTGVITNLSTSPTNWRYVKFNQNFNQPNAALQATSLGNNKWQFTITGGIRAYYGVPAGETILKIGILFRNGVGSAVQRNTDGSDMFIPIYTSNLAVRFTQPPLQPTSVPIPEPITKSVGDNISITAIANKASTMKLYLNGNVIQTATGVTTVSANPLLSTAGSQVIVAEANDGTVTTTDTIRFFVAQGVTITPLPAGVRDGINYNAGNTSATLVLYAPSKTRVSVIGEFAGSNWTEQPQYQMNKTPDGNYWWITLAGLSPGIEYGFQYLVDGTLKIADPYTEKVLDPYNDGTIPATTYPGLKAYPTGLTAGVISILQTAAPAYMWSTNNFARPDKRNLVIYELLVRDFVAAHDWKTLRDTLNYIKNLGINTIELMPFNEFEGNISWGYNPDFYFAPDKYYGPENTLKEFIDSCHKKGMAVVMDVALNHSFGLSPMVQLYWDAANNRPAANNPWFNAVPKHAYNVGYDMNHESLATRYFVSRVVEHWLSNYKIDGFRFDLSKGFTQTQTCDANGNNCNVDAWGAYDASRVAIWKRYYDTVQLKSAGAYTILEHFAVNTEETELSNYGMMLWGNLNYSYNQATMGYADGWNFEQGIASVRGWTNPYLVTYMESHDEERLMYKNLQYGNSSGSYNVKDLTTALKRNELAAAFFFTIPGPKMVWQFGEQGYDFSINYCQNGTISDNCRTDPKPIRWDYLQQANRKHLHDIYSELIKLRFNPAYSAAFTTGTVERDLANGFKWLKITAGNAKIVVIGDFDVTNQTGSVTFPNAGTWYDYLNGTTITATGTSQSFTLLPGEYHVYLNTNVTLPVTLINFNGKNNGNSNLLTWITEKEVNLNQYELQRSINGQNFSTIAVVATHSSNTYSYTDNDIDANQIYYYRLKNVDKDGNFGYSSIVQIKRLNEIWSVQVTPNPFTQKLTVTIKSLKEDKATLVLTDVSGRHLAEKNILILPGTNTIDLNETSKFASGTYCLTINTSQQQKSIKIIKRK